MALTEPSQPRTLGLVREARRIAPSIRSLPLTGAKDIDVSTPTGDEMKGALWLLGLAGLLTSAPAEALQLRWSTGGDTLGTATAREAVLLLESGPGEGSLPREWRLLWVAENLEIAITALDSIIACAGDTARVFVASSPATPEEIAAHLSTVRYCSAGPTASTLAAWAISLPYGSRGNLKVYAFDSVDPSVVLASNPVTFGWGVLDEFVTSVTVSATPNPVYTDRTVSLKAVVVPIPTTGSVTFKDGNMILGTAAIGSSGIASLMHPGLTVGTRSITASFDTFASTPVSHVVLPLPATSTSLTSFPSPSRHLGVVQLTAVVAPSTATGSITFTDGGNHLGTASLSNGMASINVPELAVGTRNLVATYPGDSAHGSSVSAELAHVVTPLAATSISLSASPDSAVSGQMIELRADVTPIGASGTVNFTRGGSLLGSVTLSNGMASLLTPGVCGGSHAYAVSYAGDSLHYGSSDSLIKFVGPRAVQLSITSTNSSSRYSEPIHFVARLSDSAQISCPLSGTVQFLIDEVAFGGPVALSGDSASSPIITTLAAGQHTVRAVFGGNSSFHAATSATILQDIESPSPRLLSVRDVLGDEGGRVKLTWTASFLDLNPFHSIESYWVLRSVPAATAKSRLSKTDATKLVRPGSGTPVVGALFAFADPDTSYFWEFLATQPAFHLPNYSYTAATTTDSVAGSNPLTVFMLMARTTGGTAWWFSRPDSGYSVDNLAPLPPQMQVTETPANGVIAFWQPSLAADFAEYRLYWGTAADFVPDSSNLVFRGTATHFMEQARALLTYYKLSAVDIHGNESSFALGQAHGALDSPTEQSLAFGLERVWPNPSRGGAVSVDFVLTRPEVATLEVLDIAGRRVRGGEVGSPAAGRQRLELTGGPALAPGLYLVRLSQGAETRVRRLVVLDQ